MEDDTNYTGEEEMQNWGAMNQQEMEQNEMEEPNEIAEQNSNKEEENPNQTEENELMYIYEWVDSIPLSRPKKNISRDFCDCVLLAEIIKHYIPRLVDLHNYPSTSPVRQAGAVPYLGSHETGKHSRLFCRMKALQTALEKGIASGC